MKAIISFRIIDRIGTADIEAIPNADRSEELKMVEATVVGYIHIFSLWFMN